jgi:hypothetical protein
MPFIVFVLLLVIALLVLGVACACISDHPAKADRAFAGISAAAPVIEVWSFAITLMLLSIALVRPYRVAVRSSPAALQRFLL